MVFKQFIRSLVHASLAGGTFWYAVHHIHNAWGMVILAWCYVAGFLLLVSTVDLLTGGRLRKRGQHPSAGQEEVIIRRVILEEITPAGEARRAYVGTQWPSRRD